ncbi:ribosome biogenesis protein SPATA5L1 [Anopheles cruzii]|uniref:ribosome biogenesis protein SPATA5L1 n=1 Tax=Anopheles cruzii TaxID=68878 RepID=UPI0022EC327D|nr:ribosome biogenesis protein SPATA5L1 [Anopheles cruzii]
MEETHRLRLEYSPHLEPSFAVPQTCLLWFREGDRKNWKFPYAMPAIGRLANGQQYLWRMHPQRDRNSVHREGYFSLDSVEAPESEEAVPSADRTLVEVVPITQPIADFESVLLDVRLDCAVVDTTLLVAKDCLHVLLRSFLSLSFFCRGARLDFSKMRHKGLCEAYVKDTTGPPTGYGSLGKGTRIEIGRILYHSVRHNVWQGKRLGGVTEARQQLTDALVTRRSSLLLAGPSGTGKYTMVKSLAVDHNYPLFEVRGLHFIRSLPGETEAELRKIFQRLEHFEELIDDGRPILLLVKDIDMICPKNSAKKGEDSSNISRIASQFLALIDQYLESSSNLVIIGTTSCIENLDPRLRRPGRLVKEITLGIPSREQRIDILRSFESDSTFTPAQLEEMAHRTTGYVGAELQLLYFNVTRERDRRNLSFQDALTAAQRKHRPGALRNAIGLVGEDRSLNLDSFGGLQQLKTLLRLCVVQQLKNPARFRQLGISPLKGILLYGPPGCAKTTLAKCLAAESGMTFLSLSAAEIYSPYVGDAERLITRVFNEARMNAPAAIFLDEIDSLVGNRGTAGMSGTGVSVNMGVLSTLLLEMDGIGQAEQTASLLSEDAKRVVVLAATNRPDMVDDALLRPGRLTKLIHIPAPDEQTRVEILRKTGEATPFAPDVNLKRLAERTERYSGADLTNLCSQAALVAATENLSAAVVTMAHFEAALQDVRPSLTQEQIDWYYAYEANKRT